MTTICLSSTYEDLKEYRRAVFDALRQAGYQVIAMEDYVATDERPVERCLNDVSRSDIYVGIFAFRYGYVPPLDHANPNGLSITELEFQEAKGKKPCLIFLVKKGETWPLNFVDACTEKDRGERVDRLREYLSREKTTSFFSSPYQLASLVQTAVTNLLKDSQNAEQTDKQTEPSGELRWDIQKNGSPYPGLMHFTRKYAPVFFGREAEVGEILDRMHQPEGRFIIISGGSGTGKSSLVDAGVLSKLEEIELLRMGKCVCKRMVPSQGSHPFDALMRVLHSETEKAGIDAYESGQRLLSEPGIFSELLKTIIPKDTSLVLFLDQMEELFTDQTKDHAKPFLSALYRAATEANLRVIATIRSDFLHHCHEYEDLLKVLRGREHYPLGRVETYMMPDMIVKSAQCAGLTVPGGLIRRLIQDTGSEPGSLPLLAFALEQLFNKRSANVLSEDVYNSLGGIAGAIGAHVKMVENRVVKHFGASATVWPTKIFQPLVVINIDGQPTRRRALKKTFADDLQPIVGLLSKERLLFAEGEGPESTVSVAHEKLFEAWPSLTRWISENRDDLFVLRQAEIEAKEWVKHGYDVKYLWHSDRLQRLRSIVQRVSVRNIDPAVKEYVAPQARLIERLTEDSLSHQDRLTIGNYLSALQDPRSGVGLTADGIPDIDWVDIPAGKVSFRQSRILVKRFRISRYLITNIQFESFINAEDGYNKPDWWKGIEWRSDLGRSTWLENNCPRTDVAWYEAVGFCRWLSARLSKKIRLPSEWEWQQAARGGHANNVYPWGWEWDAARCNNEQSGLARTTAVGVYPSGATRQKVMDMAGNVWEWCLNKYVKPDAPRAMKIDKLGDRVIRGGSWLDKPEHLRLFYRNAYKAYVRSVNIGFRLVQDID
jgi:hypothetical protein